MTDKFVLGYHKNKFDKFDLIRCLFSLVVQQESINCINEIRFTLIGWKRYSGILIFKAMTDIGAKIIDSGVSEEIAHDLRDQNVLDGSMLWVSEWIEGKFVNFCVTNQFSIFIARSFVDK